MPLFVAATVALLVGGAAVAVTLGLESVVDRALAVAVAALTQLWGCLIAAGVLGVLRPGPVALLALSSAAALVLLLGGAVPTASFARGLGRDLCAHLRGAVALATHAPWLGALFVVAGAQLLWRVVLVLVLPPYGYDALRYHLTTVAWWLQSEALARSPFVFSSRFYPANGELSFAWVALFLRDARLVGLVQLAFAVLGGVAALGLARALGAGRRSSLGAGILFLLTPAVLAQATTAYVDVIFTACFVVCLYFTVRYLDGLVGEGGAPPGPAPHLLLAGLAGGLALGTKVVGPIWLAAVTVVIVANLAAARARRVISGVAAARALFVFVVPMLATGSFWYVRNAVEYRNPLYPVAVRVAGVELFSGPAEVSQLVDAPTGATAHSPWPVQAARSWAADLRPWPPSQRFYRYDQRHGGLGPQWAFVELPLLVAFGGWAAMRRRWVEVSLLSAVALAFVASPYKWWARFTLYLAAVGAAATAVFLDRWAGRRRGRILERALVALVLVSSVLVSWRYGNQPERAGDPGEITNAGVLRLLSGDRDEVTIGRVWHPGYEVVEELPAGTRIAVDPRGLSFFLPVFGTRFHHWVTVADAGGADLDRLRAEGVQYLFATEESPIVAAATRDDARLRLTWSHGGFRLYAVGAAPR